MASSMNNGNAATKSNTNNTTNTNSKKKRKAPSGNGVDALLTRKGKSLNVGEEIRFILVKGPSYNFVSPDPVNPSAPKEQFPLIAKFPESVVKPDFLQSPWSNSRLYQQDVPKAQDDSDDEATAVDKNGAKKRWRARRKEIPKRQWILQEQVDFLQTMMAKRQRKQLPKHQTSTRYEGIPESNPSQFILLELGDDDNNQHQQHQQSDDYNDCTQDQQSSTIQITMLPSPYATISFSQPVTRKALTMTEAEQAIQDQRGQMTRYMMHAKQRMLNGTGPPVNATKNRLFGKLKKKAAADEEDDDDIMGDLTFRNRKGSGRARKELLDTLGDSGIKVDADGVLGGVNDSEFGRGRKFGRFNAEGNNNKDDQNKGGAGGEDDGDAGGSSRAGGPTTKSSADGLAMADDFYQRDVQAEYEELDYDANEQFDDDDVDLGESEVVVDNSGFADDDDDDDLDENERDGDVPSGAEGLATVAGFRLMLAKARGEITPEQAAEAAAAAAGQGGDSSKKTDDDVRRMDASSNSANGSNGKDHQEPVDHLAQIMAAAEKSAQAAKQKSTASVASANANDAEEKKKAAAASPALTGVEVDEHGQRLVTLEAIRREIWLHHGTIPMKRLMKIFDIKKKSTKDRQSKFREVVKELCTMETDPVGGRMLVLKQHYSNMG